MTHHHHPDHSGSGFFMGAIVGGVLGAMTALLFGTKQGKKVQHDAMEKFEDIEEMAKKIVPKIKKKIKHRHHR